MNFRQLECFRAVMVTGTMTRAAEVLRLSQPSISNIIGGLEHELGFSLFKRRKGRLHPTAEAEYFFKEAQRALEGLDNAVHVAEEIRKMNTGRLVIASQPGIALHFLPNIISRFLRTHPDVQFKLLSRSSHVVREMIPTQQFDIGFAEPPVEYAGVRTERISVECVCVLPVGHPLENKTVITPKDLDGEPFISLFNEHSTYFQLANAFASAGAQWKIIAETQYFATCCAFVQMGSGVTVTDPDTAYSQFGQNLVIRKFEPTIKYDLDMLIPLDRPQSGILEAFVELLHAEVKNFVTPERP